MAKTTGNPLSLTAKIFGRESHCVETGAKEVGARDTAPVEVMYLRVSDLRFALKKGRKTSRHSERMSCLSS